MPGPATAIREVVASQVQPAAPSRKPPALGCSPPARASNKFGADAGSGAKCARRRQINSHLSIACRKMRLVLLTAAAGTAADASLQPPSLGE